MLRLDSQSMPTAHAYRARRRSTRSEETRRKIITAVRELLSEGTFHESTVDQVADRAGIARATLYQHFRSRLELVDAICDSFDENPALLTIRDVVDHPDPDTALEQTIAGAVRFWSSEDPVLVQLYGVAAIDPAARDLVDRQRADRRGEMQRLARNIRRARRLRSGVTERQALARLMLLTSYDTYRELLHAGLSDRELTRQLQNDARRLLMS